MGAFAPVLAGGGTILSGLHELGAPSQMGFLKSQQAAERGQMATTRRQERGAALTAAAATGAQLGQGSIADFLTAQRQATADEMAYLKTRQSMQRSKLESAEQRQRFKAFGDIISGGTQMSTGLSLLRRR